MRCARVPRSGAFSTPTSAPKLIRMLLIDPWGITVSNIPHLGPLQATPGVKTGLTSPQSAQTVCRRPKSHFGATQPAHKIDPTSSKQWHMSSGQALEDLKHLTCAQLYPV